MQDMRNNPMLNMRLIIPMVVFMVLFIIFFDFLVSNDYMMFFFIFVMGIIGLMLIFMKFGLMKKSMKYHTLEYHKEMHARHKQIKKLDEKEKNST